ncbi:MAG TPA: hypothetical protein VFV83_06405 [Chthoniobacteraceae bacterium]|nr:hypothetical protein [Chthoniobacteraceae bacterium]
MADDHALFAAIAKLDTRDFRMGAAEMRAVFLKTDSPFGNRNMAVAEAWIERWLDVDASGALQFIGSSEHLKDVPPGMSVSARVDSVQGGVFSVLARREPAWLQQYVATLKAGASRDVGVYALLKQAGMENSATSRALLASLSNGANRPAAMEGYISGLVASDLRAAFDVAVAETAGPFRKELLQIVLRNAAARGVGAVREFIARIDDPALRRDLVGNAALELSWRSGDDLLPWLAEETQRTPIAATTREFDWWNGNVGQALETRGDTVRAADWAMTLPNDPEKKLLLRLLSRLGYRDDPALQSWLASHAEQLDVSVVEKLSRTLTEMARRDADGARAWTGTLPAGALREQMQFQLALSSAGDGDLAAASAAYALVARADANGTLARQLAATLAKHDGPTAAEWATSLPQGPARASAIASTAEQWSQRDPRGAAQWLEQMSPGAERDAAVREYALKVVYADPHAAAQWVEQVADPNARGKAAESVFWTWSNEDPIASRAWLRKLPGVEETWRTEFLRKVQ